MLKTKKAIRISYFLLVPSLLLILIVFANKQSQKHSLTLANNTEALTYNSVLTKISEKIASLVKRAEQMPKSWKALEWAAIAYIERARLTGNYQDYAKAEQLLEKAFDITGGEGGPYNTRANLYYTLHKLPEATKDVKEISQSAILTYNNKIELLTLRSDIAFQKGNYNEALNGYLALLDMETTPSNLFRLANYYWKTGNLTLADNLINEALQLTKGFEPQVQAFFYLQQGLLDLDKGLYDEALKHYKEANQIFSDWWLIDEHIAEIYKLKGQTDKALEIYERVVAETQNPEYMDALALIALDKGNEQLAKTWSNRSSSQLPRTAHGIS